MRSIRHSLPLEEEKCSEPRHYNVSKLGQQQTALYSLHVRSRNGIRTRALFLIPHIDLNIISQRLLILLLL